MDNGLDVRVAMGTAILEAISSTNYGITGSTLIEPQTARQSLLLTLASVIESDASICTEADAHRAVSELGIELSAMIASLREHYVRTGERAWVSKPISLQ